ncbi:hypothetical protein SAMN05192534_1041, partial [Alteribacillus persepolensis]
MSNLTVTFQEYTMNQLYLPMDFSDLIPKDHVARIVSDMIDALDDQLFFDAYKGRASCLPSEDDGENRLLRIHPEPIFCAS